MRAAKEPYPNEPENNATEQPIQATFPSGSGLNHVREELEVHIRNGAAQLEAPSGPWNLDAAVGEVDADLTDYAISRLVALSAERHFDLAAFRRWLFPPMLEFSNWTSERASETRTHSRLGKVATLFTDPFCRDALDVPTEHELRFRTVLSEAACVGTTPRALWMLDTWEALHKEGLYFVTFLPDKAAPPIVTLLSPRRLEEIRSKRIEVLTLGAVALSVLFNWDLAESTTFLLDGTTPTCRALSVSSVTLGGRPTPRFTIDVDMGVTPAELSRRYVESRGDFAKGFKGLGRKHTALAVYAAEALPGSQQQWRETMAKWNIWAESHLAPEDVGKPYENPAIFKRDAIKAQERLLRDEPTKDQWGPGRTAELSDRRWFG